VTALDSPLVEATHLSKWYGQVIGLNDVNVRVPRGITGLLGPNGAGKSTFMKLITGQLKPSKGQIAVFGEPIWGNPALFFRIGFCPEQDAFYERMTGLEWVQALVRLNGYSEAEALSAATGALEQVDLMPAANKKIGAYSKGMRQRVKLAQALVHDPELLFLDEPTNGMDPKGRDEMLELVRDLAHNKGISLVLSSHLLPDVEYVCDHVVVVDKGQVATQGPIADLKGPGGRVYELRVKGDESGFIAALQTSGMECHRTDEDIMRVFVPEGLSWRDLFILAAQRGVQVRHLRPSVPTLEDVFARAVGEQDVDGRLTTIDSRLTTVD
jgi:ABC-2 type transport system ATP-binding protein